MKGGGDEEEGGDIYCMTIFHVVKSHGNDFLHPDTELIINLGAFSTRVMRQANLSCSNKHADTHLCAILSTHLCTFGRSRVRRF